MKRDIYNRLLQWKTETNRKPLIVDGARQVGKTWIIKEFGKKEYSNIAYINCDKVTEMKNLFFDYDIKRIIRAFSSITEQEILPDGKTLIVLDEIQEIPLALTALKYFCEDAPEYHIIVAGSLLGISLHSGSGFPVGKVNIIKMYPMTFMEFTEASGKVHLMELINSHSWSEISSMSQVMSDLLRQYYYTGGMPEVVYEYFRTGSLAEVRKIQKRILTDYEQDFSRHVPSGLLAKVSMVWNSIPSQLAKENKKFIYGAVRKGSRAKDFEDAIEWLMKAGLVHKVLRVNKVERSLKFYEDISSFKLFISDLGLLGAMTDVTAREILTGDNYFSEYKGAFTEQYVAQEIIALDEKIYYYSKENSSLELDFLVQKQEVYPIEVKAEVNLRSKSLRNIYDSNPRLKPVRFSMSAYKEQDWMVNVPLFMIHEWISCAE